ncbi:uncharacterized protein [Lepeophtheirus salmonis]|uniref:uncharacterized protein n=1 Tax=Lepeophtheirus salmonis TaxID=72036 RepID=UPI001AEA4639|nr:protein eva-1-like [Lepeophtheirus salmonis]XP_040580849.1 protein eva-1-like [Lepeophtheirus salmonis]XP_040580850.1 protein eva-1-like [Lepeophtheirus salmonis]
MLMMTKQTRRVERIYFYLPFLLILVTHVGAQYKVYRNDPFALLSGTLRTYQKAACDSQTLSLECPVGTKISIQLVKYGRNKPSSQICPPTQLYPKKYTGFEGLDCDFPEALKFIEDKCHDHEVCSMVTAPEIFGRDKDPCFGYRKYIEVTYKCRPTKFRSREVCHGEHIRLDCDGNNKRVAIYSATFAVATNSHIYCPLKESATFSPGVYDDFLGGAGILHPKKKKLKNSKCESNYATEAIMQMCHGQKSCVVMADGASLGAPDCIGSNTNVYLKTAYACVDVDVLKTHYQHRDRTTTAATTTISAPIGSSSTHSLNKYEPSSSSSSRAFNDDDIILENIDGLIDDNTMLLHPSFADEADGKKGKEGDDLVAGLVSDIVSSYRHIQMHREKFILFVVLSIALGLALFLSILLWSMYRSKRLSRIISRPPPTSSSSSATLHSISPINSGCDAPIDLETEVQDHEVDFLFSRNEETNRRPHPSSLLGGVGPDGPITLFYTGGGGSLNRHSIASSSTSSREITPAYPLRGILRNKNPEGYTPASYTTNTSNNNPSGLQHTCHRYYNTLGSNRRNYGLGNMSPVTTNSSSNKTPSSSPMRTVLPSDRQDPKSLTLSRLSNCDHIIYG